MVPLTASFRKRWTPYALLAALTVVAAIPLLPFAQFYFLDDSFLHLFRLTEFDRLVRQGIWYPRWAPDFAFGYGYPVFSFYPPLAYYITEVIHLLGAAMPIAMTLVSVGTVGLAMAGAYALGLELFGHSAYRIWCGLLAAIAYGFFPYLLIDLYVRGALPEALGAAILPWCLWAIHRLVSRPSVGAMLLASLVFAGFVLAHNLTAFFAAPFLLGFALTIPDAPRRMHIRSWLWLAAAVALGATLTAIYSIPSLVELPLVAGSHETRELARLFDISFFKWQDVIQWSIPYEYHEQPFPISSLPMLLSAIALVLALAKSRSVWRIFAFSALMIALLMFLLLDASRPFWFGIPLVRSFQFPWRISTLIGMGMAVMISALPALLGQTDRSALKWAYRLFLLIVPMLLIWNGIANLQPKRLDNPTRELSLGQIVRAEQNMGGLGFGWLSEFLPLTVKALPTRMDSPASRENPLQVTLVEYSTTRRALTVDATNETTLRLRQFYFPGWQARIDGVPAPVFATTALGLLSMNVPAGKHTVDIDWQDTPARQIGGALSAIGVILALGLALIGLLRRDHVVGIVTMAGSVLFMTLVLAMPVLAAKSTCIQTLATDVGPDLRAIGFSIREAAFDGEWQIVDARAALDVTMYWQVNHAPNSPTFMWRLADQNGRVWSEESYLSRYGTGFPGAWVPGEIVQDEYTLALPPDLSAGSYQLQVGAGGEYVPIAALSLARGTTPAQSAPPMTQSDARFGDNIRLLGFSAPRAGRPNESAAVTLYWQAEHSILDDFTVFVHLVDNEDNLVAQQDGLTQDSFFPTSLWLPKQIVPDSFRLTLPNLSPGIYHWVVGLYRHETMDRLPIRTAQGLAPDDELVIGDLKIPMNVKASPARSVAAQFGSKIQLVGYDLSVHNYGAVAKPRPGEGLGLSLYWKTNAPIDTVYKVFVHLVDAAGQVVAQDDAQPAANTYPTLIWDPGELVLDSHNLTAPVAPGHYRIFVGVYNAASGERLVAEGGGAVLPNRQVELQALDVE